jgi:hypothetical protein
VSEALGWQGYPKCLSDLTDNWLPGKSDFVGLAWTIWNARNKTCIRKSFPQRPIDMIYLAQTGENQGGRADEGSAGAGEELQAVEELSI